MKRAECESVEFAEVEFTVQFVPRLVIRLSDGLSDLAENDHPVQYDPCAKDGLV